MNKDIDEQVVYEISKNSFEIYHISGRGIVFTHILPVAREAGELRSWVGKKLRVANCDYEITGVELFAVPDWKKQREVGFLVRGPI